MSKDRHMAQAQVCTKCSHANPADAVYCYFDGALLQGHGGNGGPVKAGQIPFATPFVFPNGQTAQNMDQLAMAFQNNWQMAKDLLKQGFLVGFFGGLGRADLAMAAREAAQFPDEDRGLDQLLARLPTQVLQSPKLRVEPLEVNLGRVALGTNRQVELQLANQGMRLVYGSVASDSKWLTLGEPPGGNQKLFQFLDETVIPVQIRGQNLRAGPKPLIGQLFLDSNGNSGNQQIVIKFRVEVPVKPFTDGVLAGATSPRQLAEKARDNPKEAAALFENGAVPRWFADNGWIYPVQGPAGSGLGAVQQFFEALGLAKAPKVEVDKQSIALMGGVGQRLSTILKVETPEKRPVYAHATADEPWLDVSQSKIEAKGRIVLINVQVPSVPARPGEILTARLRVAANGNQRFDIAVALTVAGTPGAVYAAPVASPAAPMATLAAPAAAMATPQEAVFAFADEPALLAVPAEPLSAMPAAAPAGGDAIALIAEPTSGPFGAFATGGPPMVQGRPTAAVPTRPTAQIRRQQLPPVIHALPLLVLMFCLLLAVVRDWIFGPSRGISSSGDIMLDFDPPRISIPYNFNFDPNNPNKDIGDDMRFGVVTVPPKGQPRENFKKLTFNEWGQSNSTLVKIDGQVLPYGKKAAGSWKESPKTINKRYGAVSKQSIWVAAAAPIEVTQKVERIPGEPFEENGKYKRVLDTCLVRYEIYNADNKAHKVGLRFLLDTLIGDNDGVPFTVPGKGLVQDMMEFSTPASVPDFIQALENPDLKNPGTVAQLNLRVGGKVEPPSRVLLTRWPGWVTEKDTVVSRLEKIFDWDAPLVSFQGPTKESSDSSVVMYWDEKELKPGETRVVGFSYGLGNVTTGTGALGLTVGGNFKPGGDLTITCYVNKPQPNQRVKLNLPSGFSLLDGAKAELDVPPLPQGVVGRASPVTWRVRAGSAGNYEIEVRTSNGDSQKRPITIQSGAGIFGSS
jgi:hypothetical protein